MRFEVTQREIKQSNLPHELFLTNLIANHVLMFVAALGMAGSLPWLLALVPLISFSILSYTLWRAARSKTRDTWYVMCHWQVCARRSRIFILVLVLLLVITGLGWVGYTYLRMMKEAVWALIGGLGLLPLMVTVLVLVIMESEALYHSQLAKLPRWVVERFPNPEAKVIPEEPHHHPA